MDKLDRVNLGKLLDIEDTFQAQSLPMIVYQTRRTIRDMAKIDPATSLSWHTEHLHRCLRRSGPGIHLQGLLVEDLECRHIVVIRVQGVGRDQTAQPVRKCTTLRLIEFTSLNGCR